MKEKLLKIIEHYGFDNQRKKLNEEVFELTDALFIDLRVAEELADVLVMLEQFRLCYGISEEELKKIMEEKVERQLKRIEEEKKIELPEKLKPRSDLDVMEPYYHIEDIAKMLNGIVDYLKYKEEEKEK